MIFAMAASPTVRRLGPKPQNGKFDDGKIRDQRYWVSLDTTCPDKNEIVWIWRGLLEARSPVSFFLRDWGIEY